MRYLNNIEEYQGQNKSVITLGKFDGFHRGHQKLLEEVKACVKKSSILDEKLNSIVFAFDMSVFRREHNLSYEQIMLKEEQDAFLSKGIDYLIHCPFVDQIRHMSPEAFIREIIVERFQAKYIVVGSDFRFGYKALGNVAMLKEYSEAYGYEVIEIAKEMYDNQEISSTLIKTCIQNGEIEKANAMLGYQYSIRGEVRIERAWIEKNEISIMDVTLESGKILPPTGVYLVEVEEGNRIYRGSANLDEKLMTEEKSSSIEIHLYNYIGDSEDENMKVKFLKKKETL